MADRELRFARLRTILESFGIRVDEQGARGSEVRLSGFSRRQPVTWKRMRIARHGSKVPWQVVRNIRAKFGLRDRDGVSDEEFYGPG